MQESTESSLFLPLWASSKIASTDLEKREESNINCVTTWYGFTQDFSILRGLFLSDSLIFE